MMKAKLSGLDISNWVSIGVALSTAVLAVFTAWMARETRGAASAAQGQMRLASEALAEARLAREIEWRPFLMLSGDHIKNIGRGPAINVWYVVCYLDAPPAKQPHLQESEGYFHLEPGGEEHYPATCGADERLIVLFEEVQRRRAVPTPLLSGESYSLAVCQDVTRERLYLFGYGTGGYLTWRVGDQEPPWVRALREAYPGTGMVPGDWPSHLAD